MSTAPPLHVDPVPVGSPFRAGAQAFSPPWLLRSNGSRLVYCQSLMWDALAEWTRIGVIQRFPTVAEPNALGPLGIDRKIWRGIAETDTHYAERLRAFKKTWKFAGNAPTLLRQLWEYMKPNATKIRYVANGYEGPAGAGTQFADYWTIDDSGLTFDRVSPTNWDWDGEYGPNIRFWVIVYRNDLEPAFWGVPPYQWGADDLYWAAAPGSDRSWVIDTYNIVQAFKASGSHMGPFSHAYDGGLIMADPTFTTAPWGADGPFAPTNAPGYPMPDGTFAINSNRPPTAPAFPSGVLYMSGL